ncbi:forkhead box protein R1 [Dasypus novemcinctus]|uniref:forkhead box protein R1 n=1 Tax=Dasypus novemcinctus TaxID=9361 RepID=UPI000C826DC5|nr:forkhead box protein R1 [Dasypus novemcinctus]
MVAPHLSSLLLIQAEPLYWRRCLRGPIPVSLPALHTPLLRLKVDLKLHRPDLWASLHGQVPGLLDWDMGNECFLAFTTSHLSLAEQKLARYRLRLVKPPKLPLEKKPRPDRDGPDIEPNLWMWVNSNIVYPPGKLEAAAREALTSTLCPQPPPKEEESSCPKVTVVEALPPCSSEESPPGKWFASSPSDWEETEEEEEAENQDDSSFGALPPPHKKGPLQSRRLRQASSQERRLWSRPPLNYFHLIALALRNSPPCGLNVQQIYTFTQQHFPFFQTAPEGWKNTVRHNLCFRDSFEKVPVSVQGGSSARPRSCLWKLTEEGRRRFQEEARALESTRLESIQQCMSEPDMMPFLFELESC